MRVRLRFDHWIPKKLRVDAITLYPFIFFANSRKFVFGHIRGKNFLKHEMIHIGQIRRVTPIVFYPTYLFFYFLGLLRYLNHRKAYFFIPYESEAYKNQTKKLTEAEKNELLRYSS